jgi:SAM-dependent methyltransferase
MAEQAADSRWDADGEEAQNLRRREASIWNRDYVEHVLLPLLAIPLGGTVLDVGTGFGALAFLLADLRPDLTVVGVDPEASLVEGAAAAAAGLGLSRVRFQVASGEALPFGDAQFDLVACQTVLTHVPDPDLVVVEMARVLASGGTLLAAEWTDRAAMASFDNATSPTFDEAGEAFRLTRAYGLGRKRLGRGDDLAGVRAPAMATAAGLEVVEVRLNDRVRWAMPPYGDEQQRSAIEESREWAATTAPDEEFRTWAAENLEASGVGASQVDHFILATDGDAEARSRWLARLGAGDAWLLAVSPMIITIARKPTG